MKKIIILGCPGSGKSTFAKKLEKSIGLPLIHLDNIWWKPDKTNISRSEFDTVLASIIVKDNWILDGDYSRTYEVRMKACDTIFFLDYSEDECMSGIQARVGIERSDMPWIEDQLDPELVEEVHRYREKNRPMVLKLLEKYREKEIYVFKNREETEAWLKAFRQIEQEY